MSIMKGKRGLIMGVANERSIAWGMRKHCENGAELAFHIKMKVLEKAHTIDEFS